MDIERIFRETMDPTGEGVEAGHTPVFITGVHQRLHADTDAQKGRAAGQDVVHQRVDALRAYFRHAIADGTDAGQYHVIGSGDTRLICSNFNLKIGCHMF